VAGFHDATADVAQIDAWWAEADYNVAICPDDAGWCVIDLDPGGETAWIALLTGHGEHAPTYTVETPRGGLHLYFVGRVPSSVGKLGAHVDTRGQGGYVLVPPSIVNGKPYRLLHDRDLAPLPDWIAPRLAVVRQHAAAATDERDTPAAVSRGLGLVRAMVGRGDVAISGCGGNNRTYQVSAELLNLGLSRDRALRLLLDEWNQHCLPPWDRAKLASIVDNAVSYAQNESGAWDVGTAEEAFGRTAAFREAMKVNAVKQSRYRMMSAADFDNEPEPAWIIPGLLPEDALVLWVGPSQSFKSFLLLDAFLSVATGTETFNAKPSRGLVLYGAIEDLRNIGRARRQAWQHGRGGADIELDSFRACLVPFLGMPGDYDEWCSEIDGWLAGRPLRLIAIDTAGKTLAGLNENDSSTVRLFWKMCDDLRERFHCTVVAVHHQGKDTERGARGSSAWLADFDSLIETRRPSIDQLAVEVRVRKHKNAADGQKWTFQGHHVAGSLVFSPTTSAEHAETLAEDDPLSPVKIGRVLAAEKAHSRATALDTPRLWQLLGGRLGAEDGPRRLEKEGRGGRLRAWCEEADKALWWFYERENT
jgi:hypothetical protein